MPNVCGGWMGCKIDGGLVGYWVVRWSLKCVLGNNNGFKYFHQIYVFNILQARVHNFGKQNINAVLNCMLITTLPHCRVPIKPIKCSLYIAFAYNHYQRRINATRHRTYASHWLRFIISRSKSMSMQMAKNQQDSAAFALITIISQWGYLALTLL